MEKLPGAIIITAADNPKTIYEALAYSREVASDTLPDRQPGDWVETVDDAMGSLRDGFGFKYDHQATPKPDGRAIVYLSLRSLEGVMIQYGIKLNNSTCVLPELAHCLEAGNVCSVLKSVFALQLQDTSNLSH